MDDRSPLLDLTPVQRRFVEEYCLSGQATAAYVIASPGTKRSSARSASSRLMTKPEIKKAIAWLRSKSAAPPRPRPVLVDLTEYKERAQAQVDAERETVLSLIEAKALLSRIVRGDVSVFPEGMEIRARGIAIPERLAAFDRLAQLEGWNDNVTPADELVEKAARIREVRSALSQASA